MGFVLPTRLIKKLHHPGLVLLLVAASLGLVYRCRQLRQEVERTRQSYHTQVGLIVPPLRGEAIDGTERILHLAKDRFSLVLVFAPMCRPCAENWAAWDTIVRNLGNSTVEVVYVDLSDNLDLYYYEKRGILSKTLLAKLSGGSVLDWSLHGTPRQS